MKVFIAGASGVLGRRLVRQFVARGHSVIGQVRSAKAESAVREAGGEPRHADLFDAESLARAAEGCDTVIHAATAIPTKQKTTPADWAMNDHIRRKGTRCLTEAAAKIGAKTYIQQSIVWVAQSQRWISVRRGFADRAGLARAIVHGCGSHRARSGIVGRIFHGDPARRRVLRLRFGAHAHARRRIRKRAMPIIGSGDAVWAVIHTDDAASAYVAVAERPRDGVWHIVDDEPVSVRALLESIAERLGAPRPRRVPVWLASGSPANAPWPTSQDRRGQRTRVSVAISAGRRAIRRIAKASIKLSLRGMQKLHIRLLLDLRRVLLDCVKCQQ